MPTTRARHTITETDEVARALEEAARRWPEDRRVRSRLLLHLVEEGHRAIVADRQDRTGSRRAAVRRTSGALTGVYPDGYLSALRDEWAA
jgi:hypothetical protein